MIWGGQGKGLDWVGGKAMGRLHGAVASEVGALWWGVSKAAGQEWVL